MTDLLMYDTITTILSHIVTVFIFIIGNTISLVQYGNEHYPQATQIALQILGVYTTYKIAKRMVKSWINMVVFTIKAILFIIAVTIALIVYIRGAKFVNQDIPYIMGVWNSYDNEATDSVATHVRNAMYSSFVGSLFSPGVLFGGVGDQQSKSTKKGSKKSRNNSKNKSKKGKDNKDKKHKDKGKKFEKEAASFLNEYGIEVDSDYLDYFNENFGFDNQKDDSGNIMDSISDALSGLGVDLNNMGDFMDRFNV